MEANQPDILIVRSTKVTPHVIDASHSLALVIRAGAGVDTIDVDHASSKGIFVANCPGKNATAVAELAMGMMINIDRRLAENYGLLKDSKWRKGMFSKALGLKGRTLGLIGFGNIARRVAQRALAFEMNIVAYDVFEIKSDEVTVLSSIEEVLTQSDIVSVHVPCTKDTKEMINSDFLRQMKTNGVLINTARGDLVNEEDMFAHLESHPDFWYGADVYQNEPSGKECDWDHPLAQHPRVYGTHHIGASTKQAENEIGQEAVRICQVFSQTGQVDDINWVNKERFSPRQALVIKATNDLQVYSQVFKTLEAQKWAISSCETLPCKGGKSLIFKMLGEGCPTIVDDLKNLDSVISATFS